MVDVGVREDDAVDPQDAAVPQVAGDDFVAILRRSRANRRRRAAFGRRAFPARRRCHGPSPRKCNATRRRGSRCATSGGTSPARIHSAASPTCHRGATSDSPPEHDGDQPQVETDHPPQRRPGRPEMTAGQRFRPIHNTHQLLERPTANRARDDGDQRHEPAARKRDEPRPHRHQREQPHGRRNHERDRRARRETGRAPAATSRTTPRPTSPAGATSTPRPNRKAFAYHGRD